MLPLMGETVVIPKTRGPGAGAGAGPETEEMSLQPWIPKVATHKTRMAQERRRIWVHGGPSIMAIYYHDSGAI